MRCVDVFLAKNPFPLLAKFFRSSQRREQEVSDVSKSTKPTVDPESSPLMFQLQKAGLLMLEQQLSAKDQRQITKGYGVFLQQGKAYQGNVGSCMVNHQTGRGKNLQRKGQGVQSLVKGSGNQTSPFSKEQLEHVYKLINESLKIPYAFLPIGISFLEP